MVEFVIAIVGVLVVAAGILLLAELHRADTDTAVEATAEAIDDSMGSAIPSSFTPVDDWREGRDAMRHTKDDRPAPGSFSGVRARVARRTAPGGDWSGLCPRPTHALVRPGAGSSRLWLGSRLPGPGHPEGTPRERGRAFLLVSPAPDAS